LQTEQEYNAYDAEMEDGFLVLLTAGNEMLDRSKNNYLL
jgi:hypothetical protein